MRPIAVGIVFGLAVWTSPASAAEFTEVRPILEKSCFQCHNAKVPLGGVALDTAEGAQAAAAAIAPTLEPGSKNLMPPAGALPEAQRKLLAEWAEAGADWPAGVVLGEAPPEDTDERALAEAVFGRLSGDPDEVVRYTEQIPRTSVTFEMAPIPGGEFLMGSPESEAGRTEAEGPQRKVKVDPFWMGVTEVTWDLYRMFMFAESSGEKKGDDEVVDGISRPTTPYVEMSFGMGVEGYPAISMTQHAAQKFTQWLSAKTGRFYRLPTEAEWEYACRAGTTAAFSFGNDPADIGEYAWYWENSDYKYGKVGEKKPNPWGLHDMHGNVMEWTLDAYTEKGYEPGAQDNPWVRAKTLYPRTARGGSWNDDPEKLRCAARVGSDPEWKMQDPQLPKSIWYLTDAQGLGLRLVRPVKTPSADEMFEYWNSGLAPE